MVHDWFSLMNLKIKIQLDISKMLNERCAGVKIWQADEMPKEAASWGVQHAEEVRQWCQAWPVNGTSREAALQRAQHAEKVRQWHQSEWARETPDTAALPCTQVGRSQAARYPPTPNYNTSGVEK
jgi:hypothetical protein